jgi:hypothetical protein
VAGTLLFLGLALWWSAWFPYAPGRVRAAIPAQAVLVGEHHHLAGDAGALLQNASLRRSYSVMGGNIEDLDAFMVSGLGRWLTPCLGGRYAVTAYVPYSANGGPAAWMSASWGGTRAQATRWMMEAGLFPGWTRLPGRSPIACYALDGAGAGPVLSAAVYEGVVLLCYSRDPGGVRRMVRRLAYGDTMSDLPSDIPAAPDRLQLRWGDPDAPRGQLEWDLSSTNRLALHASWASELALPLPRTWGHRGGFTGLVPGPTMPPMAPTGCVQLAASDRAVLAAGLGRVSGGVVLAPLALLEALPAAEQDEELWPLYIETLKPWLDEKGLAAIGLLREEYSGRLLSIKTPSLVAAFSVRPGLDLGTVLPPLLDRWNAALGSALLARRRGDEGGSAFYIIDDARRGIYSSMKAEEKPVLWRSGNWLFIASNLKAAQEVNRRLEQPGGPHPQGDWWDHAAAAPDAMHTWVDFAAAGKAVRKLTALYAIVQIAQGEGRGPALALMEQTGQTVKALEPFGEGVASLCLKDDRWILDAGVGR